MDSTGRRDFTILEWLLLFGAAGIAIATAELMGIRQKWEDALVYTVIVFTTIIVAFRASWGRMRFWQTLAPLFALHIVGISILVCVLPPSVRRLPWLLLTAAGMVEALLMAGVLWKRTVASRAGSSAE